MSAGRSGIGWLEVGRQEAGGQGKELSRCRRGVCHWEMGGTGAGGWGGGWMLGGGRSKGKQAGRK